MHVAVLGASGRAGSEIVQELSRRGHQVLAIARKPEAIAPAPGVTAKAGDASDPAALAELIRGVDAVVSAMPFQIPAETLLSALKAAGVSRLLVTGGAASLKNANGERLVDTDAIPVTWRPAVMKAIDFLADLKKEETIDWVFFSPAFNFVVGPRTGQFRLGGDDLIVDDAGDSRISFADYAIAMVDEVEGQTRHRERFTIGY
jgi:putative NADH-flavin reductase